MAGSSLFQNLARGAKVLALLLFLLPWVTVSCSPDALQQAQSGGTGSAPRLNLGSSGMGAGVPIANASGLNMALGQLNMLLPNREAGAGRGEPGKATQAPAVAAEIGVIAGFALVLVGLLGSFLLKGAAAALAGIGSCVLAIGALCYSVFVSYPPAVRAALAANNPSGAARQGTPTPEEIAQILSVKAETAFYIVLLVLILAVLFNALAMRKPAAVTVAAAAPAPPPAEPPTGT